VNPGGQGHPAPAAPPDGRPVDVDTGFWLWVAALPLMIVAYVVDVLAPADRRLPALVVAVSLTFVVVLAVVVLTFLILLRHGYRWARTVLTAGGVTSVVYTATSLFTVERPAAAAVTYAVSAILGSVLIAGGVFLLHRKDAHVYFTR
jgi:hypothetical protein